MIGTVGIIGGGQLGRMLIEHGFWKIIPSLKFIVIDPSDYCSCSHLDPTRVSIVKGSLYNKSLLEYVANKCDAMTFEIEHFENEFKRPEKLRFVPALQVLDKIKQKDKQKAFLQQAGIPTVAYEMWTDTFGPHSETIILKTSQGGYDGLGVFKIPPQQTLDAEYVIRTPSGSSISLGELAAKSGGLFIEEYIEDRREISIIVAVQNGEASAVYEPVEMQFSSERNILSTLHSSTLPVCKEMEELAIKTALAFQSDGLYAVEMFYDERTKNCYVNEVAPRVHNSGHHTIDSHDISQFEMMARIVLGLKVSQPVKLRDYFMQNILGPVGLHNKYRLENICGVLPETAKLYDYQKDTTKPYRKLGHLTCLDVQNSPIHHNWIRVVPADKPLPQIGIIMGSQSDLEIMNTAGEILGRLGIAYEMTVVSAHRTPDRLKEYAITAKARGLKVIIAGAGGSAHLPSMIAAHTYIPVIGVPIWKPGKPHAGQDALLSIVQMPPGVPVACMAVNGAQNAAIFAASILGCESLTQYRKEMTQLTEGKVKIS